MAAHAHVEPEILLIDDDPEIRATLDEILHECGFSVATAENGREALDWLGKNRPRLILLELSMPVMNGFEFRAAQVKSKRLAAIPTVVVTATVRAELDRLGDVQV